MDVDSGRLRACLAVIAADLDASRDELCRLDGLIGDADHGIAMALGFAAARDAAGGLDPAAEGGASAARATPPGGRSVGGRGATRPAGSTRTPSRRRC
jgi:hypothetical protein